MGSVRRDRGRDLGEVPTERKSGKWTGKSGLGFRGFNMIGKRKKVSK